MSFILQPWQLLLAILAGWIREKQQNVIEYLRTENQVLKEKLGKKRILHDDNQRRRLAVKGKVLGRKVLEEIGTLFTPDTILRWHRMLVAQKWDHSDKRAKMGRPVTPQEVVDSSCNSRGKIQAGATTGSPTPWPTSGTRCPTKQWATS